MLKVTTNIPDVIKQTIGIQKRLQLACKDAMDMYAKSVHADIQKNLHGRMLQMQTGYMSARQGYETAWDLPGNLIRASHFNEDPVAAIHTWGHKGSYPITAKGMNTPWTTIRGQQRSGSDLLVFEYQGKIWKRQTVNHQTIPPVPFMVEPLAVHSYSFGRTMQTALRGRGLI